jgi:hypothetical protein
MIVVLAELFIKKEMIDTRCQVVFEPLLEIPRFIANPAAESHAVGPSCTLLGNDDLPAEGSEIGMNQALAKVDRAGHEWVESHFFPQAKSYFL